MSTSPPPRPFARPRKRKRHLPPSVRPNPPHYILDLSPQSQTAETRICSLLLSTSIRSISLSGLPGTGKTVALRAVAHHPPIQAKFRDGVALLALSKTTDETALMRELRSIVSAVGGKMDATTDEEVIAAAARCLASRHVLLLLDDVCEHASIFMDVKRLVAAVSAPGSSSAVLSSTRSLDAARMLAPRGSLSIRPLEAESVTCRAILCAHAGLERGKFDVMCRQRGSPIMAVLKKCGGLPMALAVAGGAIKRLLNGAAESNHGVIWMHYRAYLQDNFNQFGDISGLFRALENCVGGVRVRGKWPVKGGVKITLMKLGGLEDGTWLSYARCHSLWGITSKADLAAVISGLAGQCLVVMKTLRGDLGIEVPTIVLDYCRFLRDGAMAGDQNGKEEVKEKVTAGKRVVKASGGQQVANSSIVQRVASVAGAGRRVANASASQRVVSTSGGQGFAKAPGGQTVGNGAEQVAVPVGHVLLSTGGQKAVVADDMRVMKR